MQRNYLAAMLTALVALAVVTAGAFAAFGSAGAQDVGDDGESPANQSIHVSATGTAESAPDEAVLELAVTAEGEDVGAIRDEIASGSEELTSALDELGVEYETTEYDISQPRFPREERDRPAYVGAHTFEVTLDDPDRAGAVIDAAADAGAEVGDLELTLSDEERETLRDEAIQDAMDDARHQADTLATESDLEVTNVRTVDAAQQRFSPVSYDGARNLAQEDAAQSTEVVTGDVSVTYSVSVTYNAS